MSRVETKQVTTMWQDNGADPVEQDNAWKERRKILKIYWNPHGKGFKKARGQKTA